MKNEENKGKIIHIKKKKLFIQMEDCKMNFDSDINKFNPNEINDENLRTYNNYSLKFNLKSNNKNNNEDNNNEYYLTEKNENTNFSNNKRIIPNKQSQIKNNNYYEKIKKELNKSDAKQSLENNNNTEKEDDIIIPNMSSIENKISNIKEDSSKKQIILQNNFNDTKENKTFATNN